MGGSQVGADEVKERCCSKSVRRCLTGNPQAAETSTRMGGKGDECLTL